MTHSPARSTMIHHLSEILIINSLIIIHDAPGASASDIYTSIISLSENKRS